MQFLKPSKDPISVLDKISDPNQPSIRRMYLSGFESFMNELPVLDPKGSEQDQKQEIKLTQEVMEKFLEKLKSFNHNLPSISDGEFGRAILAVEDPKIGLNGELIPGTELVLALWGKGFSSHVHGHSPGYIHEALVRGAFEVDLFDIVFDPTKRFAKFREKISQTTFETFCSVFVQDIGQEPRSNVIHSFTALEYSESLHYLPEHVRDTRGNRFDPIFHEVDFHLDMYEYKRIDPNQAIKFSEKEDVYLVRSPSLPDIKDHFIVITGGLVEKPHGLRPEDIVFPVKKGTFTPLDNFNRQDFVVLKLRPFAKNRFLEMIVKR